MQIKDLAARSGVSISMLRKIRLGQNLSMETADSIAAVFGIPSWIMIKEGVEELLLNHERLERVLKIYGGTTDEGRQILDKAAEAAKLITLAGTFDRPNSEARRQRDEDENGNGGSNDGAVGRRRS